jgi:hypothetical protein
MKKTLTISSMALGFLALAVGLVFAAGGTPQASITLQNSDAKYCYTHNNTWTLTKEVTGNGLPAYVGSFGDLNELVGTLNGSFDSCTVSAFPTSYLCPICP